MADRYEPPGAKEWGRAILRAIIIAIVVMLTGWFFVHVLGG